jgi:hypothetical protein
VLPSPNLSVCYHSRVSDSTGVSRGRRDPPDGQVDAAGAQTSLPRPRPRRAHGAAEDQLACPGGPKSPLITRGYINARNGRQRSRVWPILVCLGVPGGPPATRSDVRSRKTGTAAAGMRSPGKTDPTWKTNRCRVPLHVTRSLVLGGPNRNIALRLVRCRTTHGRRGAELRCSSWRPR